VLTEYPNTKVAMVASNWGLFDDQIKADKYPILMSNDKEVELVRQLKEKTGKPDLVWCHYSDEWMLKTHNKWTDELKIKVIGLMNASDVTVYHQGEVKPEYKSDINFVGGYWGYKAINLDRYILPLCYPVGKYNIKIWGNQKWPVPQFLGYVDNNEVKHILASAKVCPNISEPHSNAYGFDVVERPFKTMTVGGFCISDYVIGLRDIFPADVLPMAESPNEMHELIDYYIQDVHQDDIQHMKKQAVEIVVANHTYHHRAIKLLQELNL
jgi:spore maturation protein CgeB